MISERLRLLLSRYLPTDAGLWSNTTVIFSNRTALMGYRAQVPIAWWEPRGRFPVWVTSRLRPKGQLFPRGLEVVGVSLPGKIMLGIPEQELETAAGQSLLAHELVHQEQYRTIPGFEGLYEQADQQSDPDKPWENPYELPAYRMEREVYCAQVKAGTPEGSWVPLGVQLWGCPL